MKKIQLILSLLFIIVISPVNSQTGSTVEVYLLTCGPGTETYSIYGHSAIRIVNPEKNTDLVYNWGVFDFSTPNFVWKFAKGRLNYMLGVESLQQFLQIYMYEQRYVYSQRINLEPDEIEKLFLLISENLKPENVKYRYDFFYDDCSTRIRDLLEKSVGEKLLYPPAEKGEIPTFREMVGKYQDPFPWLAFGIDLIMGSPGDKKAFLRDRMFLPLEMKDALSGALINRSGKEVPLLRNHEVILDFDPPVARHRYYSNPVTIFALFLIVVIMLTTWLKSNKVKKSIDIAVFSVFSVLALMMIFFNFFTDHQQMKLNLNIIWLNPIILFCLGALILNKGGLLWFRIVFFISLGFLIIQLFLPQEFNSAIYPLLLILMVRSSVRSVFSWNPFGLK